MTPYDENDLDWFRDEEDELVRRLRGLEWPEVSPDVRQRCWEEFRRRISERQAGAAVAEAPGVGSYNVGERHAFSRRVVPMRARAVLGERLAAASGLSRVEHRPRFAASIG